MPFKETPEGQTHSYNDGCGEPEHNDRKSPREIAEDLHHAAHMDSGSCNLGEDCDSACEDEKRYFAKVIQQERLRTLEELKVEIWDKLKKMGIRPTPSKYDSEVEINHSKVNAFLDILTTIYRRLP